MTESFSIEEPLAMSEDAPRVVSAVNASPLRADLHHLLNIDPFYNARHGGWDTGWSCRDHAVVVAALMTAADVQARVVHGLNMFVEGPTSTGEPPVGIGNEQGQTVRGKQNTHSWVEVPGFGIVDVSPRLNERLPGPFQMWRSLSTERGGPLGSAWDVPGLATVVDLVDGSTEYEHAVARATHAVDTVTAVYWPRRADPFSPGMLSAEYIHSPLTEKALPIAGADFYLLLAAHLHALSSGRRRTLAGVSQQKAWRFLTDMHRTSPELLEEFRDLLNANGRA